MAMTEQKDAVSRDPRVWAESNDRCGSIRLPPTSAVVFKKQGVLQSLPWPASRNVVTDNARQRNPLLNHQLKLQRQESKKNTRHTLDAFIGTLRGV